jgi:CHASE2 domain-containing sensor protein
VVVGVLLVPTLVLSGFTHVPGLGPARATATLAFMAGGPGLAVMGLLRLDDLLLELSLALALSLALDTIVAMALLLLGQWDPPMGLLVLEAVAAIGAVAQAYQVFGLKQRRHRQPATLPPR